MSNRSNCMKDAVFFLLASVTILPAPTVLYAWHTGKTLAQVLYR